MVGPIVITKILIRGRKEGQNPNWRCDDQSRDAAQARELRLEGQEADSPLQAPEGTIPDSNNTLIPAP